MIQYVASGDYMGKITINYDLYNEILNARGKFIGFKVLRDKWKYALLDIPFFLSLDFLVANTLGDLDIPSAFVEQCLICASMRYLPYQMIKTFLGLDVYKEEATVRLFKVSMLLNTINVITNSELLLNSELDSRNYEIQKDSDNKKVLVENKYIMVPTHNPMFNDEGETQMTSLHQEHIIGTKNYSLSVGINQKNKQKILNPLFSVAKR